MLSKKYIFKILPVSYNKKLNSELRISLIKDLDGYNYNTS